jgi:eukaryotic-like serine/threonine-protein kinase
VAAEEVAFTATEPHRFLMDRWTVRGIDPSDITCDSGGTIVPRSVPPAPGSLPLLPTDAGGDIGAQLDMQSSREIGRGAMGVVFAARQTPMRREVAVKCLPEGADSSEERAQVLREARVTGVLEHPNVVPVHLLGVDRDGSPVIVMKRITGTRWRDLLADADATKARGAGDALSFHLQTLMQVCNAVHYAHAKGIVHRDLKPENVMIGEFGEVYVLDWGLAVSLDAENDLDLPHHLAIDAVAGTPSYMPPEMALADGARIGPKSDVYTLGAVLHEIVTGEPRHMGQTLIQTLAMAAKSYPISYGPDVPAGLAAICNRATAAEPNERYESADALRSAIAEYMRHAGSLRLSTEVMRRLPPLRMLVRDAKPEDEEGAAEIYRTFGECRFALQEALRQWPENGEARRGLQELVELMVARDIGLDDYNGARRLLRELPEPCAELEAKLEELRDKQERERAAVASLKELGHRVDKSIGKRERAVIMAAMAIIWTSIYFGLGWLSRATNRYADHETFMVVNGAYGAFLFVAGRRWKSTLFETEVNKRFLWSLWAAFAAGAVLWPAARWCGIPFALSAAFQMLLYATVCWMAAAEVDSKLVWVAPPYVAGFVAALVLPQYAWETLGIATAGAMTAAAAVWRPAPANGA